MPGDKQTHRQTVTSNAARPSELSQAWKYSSWIRSSEYSCLVWFLEFSICPWISGMKGAAQSDNLSHDFTTIWTNFTFWGGGAVCWYLNAIFKGGYIWLLNILCIANIFADKLLETQWLSLGGQMSD